MTNKQKPIRKDYRKIKKEGKLKFENFSLFLGKIKKYFCFSCKNMFEILSGRGQLTVTQIFFPYFTKSKKNI